MRRNAVSRAASDRHHSAVCHPGWYAPPQTTQCFKIGPISTDVSGRKRLMFWICGPIVVEFSGKRSDSSSPIADNTASIEHPGGAKVNENTSVRQFQIANEGVSYLDALATCDQRPAPVVPHFSNRVDHQLLFFIRMIGYRDSIPACCVVCVLERAGLASQLFSASGFFEVHSGSITLREPAP